MTEAEKYGAEVYASFKGAVLDLEKRLGEGEKVCVSGMGPNCPDFFLKVSLQRGPLISLIGETADGRAESLVFSPGQFAIRLFAAKRDGERTPIGFLVK